MTPENPNALEMRRILYLPTSEPVDAEEAEIASMDLVLREAHDAGDRLRPIQVAALRAWQTSNGAICPIGVGGGKSGICLLIAQDALTRGLARKVVLLMPPQLIKSFRLRHYPEWRRRIHLPASLFWFLGKNKHNRELLAKSGAPGIYLLPYSLMSVPDTVEFLRWLDADLFVADEAHNLKNPRSACTKRLLDYFKNREAAGRPARLVAMSGTMTSKSLMDYAHLAVAALGDHAPVPRSANMIFSWSQALDSSDPDGPKASPGLVQAAMRPLVQWAGLKGNETETYRAAFRRRLVTAPGVVATSDERPEASLLIQDLPERKHGVQLGGLMSKVQDGWTTPQGEPIDHPFHVYKWMFELSAGFYNSLVWPTADELAKGRRIEPTAAEALLTRARAHLRAKQSLDSEMREFFKTSPAGLDTPREVGRSMQLHGDRDVGPVLYDLWRHVRSLDFPGRPDRRAVPVRIDPYKVEAAVEWARGGYGIVWYYHEAFGRWLYEAIADAGLEPVWCPAGADQEIEAHGDPVKGGTGEAVVVASVSSHGIGRNLQAFDRMLYAQWIRSDVLAEQSLGREHRSGQRADEVVASTMIWTPWDHLNRGATLVDSEYVFQTIGTEMRVLYADYDPLPQVFPPSLLAAAGMQPRALDGAGQKKLAERFDSGRPAG